MSVVLKSSSNLRETLGATRRDAAGRSFRYVKRCEACKVLSIEFHWATA
jgi:hypothetical protein